MAGGGSGGGGSTTTVQKSDPWEGQQSYLKEGFKKAQDLYMNQPGPQMYQGQTIAPFSNQTQQALDLTQQRALNGSAAMNAANNQMSSTLNGDYLYGGDGFNAAVDAATRKAMPQVNSQFERAGTFNSGLAKTAQTQAVADAFASQYGDERQNQMRAAAFAPTMAQNDYTDISALANVGGQYDALNQANLDQTINKYNYNQNLPNAQLQNYMNTIQGNYGSTQTSTSPLYQNQGAGMLGGALGGLSLASSLGASMSPAAGAGMMMGPWGLAAGAGLGLLGGLF